MKQYYCIFLLLFSFSFYAQNDTIPVVKKTNISVVSADKMNVVYRGVPNYLSIAVPNTKVFSVTAPGLQIIAGKYILKAGVGREVNIIVVYKNRKGISIAEKHVFRIKNLPQPLGLINEENCKKCLVSMSKKELETAIISTKMEDFLFVESDSEFYKVKNFDVKFSEENIISVKGNMITKEVMNEIEKLKNKEIFEINNISFGFDCIDCINRRALSIKVIIAD